VVLLVFLSCDGVFCNLQATSTVEALAANIAAVQAAEPPIGAINLAAVGLTSPSPAPSPTLSPSPSYVTQLLNYKDVVANNADNWLFGGFSNVTFSIANAKSLAETDIPAFAACIIGIITGVIAIICFLARVFRASMPECKRPENIDDPTTARVNSCKAWQGFLRFLVFAVMGGLLAFLIAIATASYPENNGNSNLIRNVIITICAISTVMQLFMIMAVFRWGEYKDFNKSFACSSSSIKTLFKNKVHVDKFTVQSPQAEVAAAPEVAQPTDTDELALLQEEEDEEDEEWHLFSLVKLVKDGETAVVEGTCKIGDKAKVTLTVICDEHDRPRVDPKIEDKCNALIAEADKEASQLGSSKEMEEILRALEYEGHSSKSALSPKSKKAKSAKNSEW